MYVKSLAIYDFRCFRKAVMELRHPGETRAREAKIPNVNLLLGNNGGGKSSVLRALAIAALAPVLADSGFLPYRLVRRPDAQASLLKTRAILDPSESGKAATGSKPMELDLLARVKRRASGSIDSLTTKRTPASPLWDHLFDDSSPAFFVVGYGATRRVESQEFSASSASKARGLRYQRVASLFEDHVALRPLQAWLPRLKRTGRRFREVVSVLNKALPDNIRFKGEFDRRDGQYLFSFDSRPTPFPALSDGYKAFIGWVADLLGHLNDCCPARRRLVDVSGLVLVDEIDLHLHPEWQRSVVPMVAAAFPRLQFVFTSHSPLVAGTLERENIFVTGTAEDGTATVTQFKEMVHGRSAEQILLSPYFNLPSTRAESFTDAAKVLFNQAAKGDSNAALRYLERLTNGVEPAEEKG